MSLRPRDAALRFARSDAAVSTTSSHLTSLAPVGHAERRRHPRHSLGGYCWIDSEQLTVLGPTQDVGVGGLFVRTAAPLAHGALVEVTLKMGAGPDTLTARAMVARAVPVSFGSWHGVGLEFVRIHRGQGVLRRLVDLTMPWLRPA